MVSLLNYFIVNKTSIFCIVVGLINAFAPMDEVNTAIFGKYNERISLDPYDPRKMSDHYNLRNPATRDITLREIREN